MIELSNVHKSYLFGRHQVQALRGVSLTIEQGDFVAIMGPSGSGKSTLMHLLGLLDVPTSGAYLLDGRDIARLGEEALAGHRRDVFGFVFQQFHLLSRMNAVENVSLPLIYSHREEDPALARELLAKVGLDARLLHRPNELSGGQQQRVAIARALVNRPRVILADEPTGDLDTASEQEILQLLRDLNRRGLTVIVVTHEEEVGRAASRLIRMRDGVIVSDERLAPIAPPSQAAPPPAPSKPPGRGAEVKAYLRQGLANLGANKARTALSTLGILMGVAAVVTMLAIGRGAQKDIEAQIASMGSNLLVLKCGAVRAGVVAQEAGTVTRITLSDVDALKERISLVADASPAVEGTVQATFHARNVQTRILGVGPAYDRVRAATPVLGRFFTDDENRKRSRVALVGPTVARELFGEQSPVGERIRINRVNFLVVGVLPERGAAATRDQDDVIVTPVLTAMHRVLGKNYVDSVDIEVSDRERMDQAELRIREVMRLRHKVGETESLGATPFEVHNLATVKAALSQSSRTLSWLLASIAVISLLVGGIGIMNIMLVSVTERTREIGLRKAIGARASDILNQFLAEAVVVTCLGGIAGVVLGFLGTGMLSWITGWTTSITAGSVLLALGFSVGIGLIFGIYPARQASRLHPIEALRHD